MYKSIDLFAGIGGIRLGFDQAFGNDIKTVFISEWDEKAVETYKANFNDSVDVVGDITKVDEKDIPKHDILLAGFPCQAFSLAGHKKGFEDARGTLFFDVARIIKRHKPKVVFCENVKNLVNHDRDRTFQVIKNILEDLGYAVFYKVLNSKNFGVPQNRERIYIVAFRKDIAPEKFIFPQKTDDTKVIKDIVEEDEVSSKYYLSTAYLTSLKRHKERHASKGNGFGYEIREFNSVAGVIVCGGMGRERNLIIDKRLTNFAQLPGAGQQVAQLGGPAPCSEHSPRTRTRRRYRSRPWRTRSPPLSWSSGTESCGGRYRPKRPPPAYSSAP